MESPAARDSDVSSDLELLPGQLNELEGAAALAADRLVSRVLVAADSNAFLTSR